MSSSKHADAIELRLYASLYVRRLYFMDICDVANPEQQFNRDQYTDVSRVTKPIIYISIAELVETHKVEHTRGLGGTWDIPAMRGMWCAGDRGFTPGRGTVVRPRNSYVF